MLPSNDETYNDLLINKTLVFPNYSLFSKLKSKKIRRDEKNLVNFEAVNAFQGTDFVKKQGTVCNQGASRIPIHSFQQNFLGPQDMVKTTAQHPTTPPFPREEITALLLSNTQQWGHTVFLRHDQEASSATTAIHRDHNAQPHPEIYPYCPPVTIIPVFLIV